MSPETSDVYRTFDREFENNGRKDDLEDKSNNKRNH